MLGSPASTRSSLLFELSRRSCALCAPNQPAPVSSPWRLWLLDRLMLPGLGEISVWEAGAAHGVTSQQWVCLGLHDNDEYAESCGHGKATAVLPSLEIWKAPIAAALRMGYRVVCPNFYSNPQVAQGWRNSKTTKVAQQTLLKVFSMHGSRVLLMGDGQGGKVALKLLGEMQGLSNLLVGAMVFNMPSMRKESFAKVRPGAASCLSTAHELTRPPCWRARRSFRQTFPCACTSRPSRALPPACWGASSRTSRRMPAGCRTWQT